jgi:hypothetical protein
VLPQAAAASTTPPPLPAAGTAVVAPPAAQPVAIRRAQLRSAQLELGRAGDHVERLAALLSEARQALVVLHPSSAGGSWSGDGAAPAAAQQDSDGANGTGGAGGPALRALALERQLFVTMGEVLSDVEGELRGVGGRVRGALAEIAMATGDDEAALPAEGADGQDSGVDEAPLPAAAASGNGASSAACSQTTAGPPYETDDDSRL